MKISFKELVIYFILFFAGFQGIIFFFAELNHSETELSRFSVAFAYYFITALLVHWLSEFRGEKAYLLLWGVGIVSFLNIPELIEMGNFEFAMHNLLMVFIPLIAIYLAGKSVTLFTTNKKPKSKKRKIKKK